MSLGIGIKGPEGIVLAAESRVTLEYDEGGVKAYSNYDHATKLLTFGDIHNFVGAVTYGLATIGQRTAHSFLPEFESQLPDQRIPVQDFAQKLSDFYMAQWNAQTNIPQPYQGSLMVFIIAGFDAGEPYGKIYQVVIPSNPVPQEMVGNGQQFNFVWGGQREIIDRIIQGVDTGLLQKIKTDLGLSTVQSKQLDTILPEFTTHLPIGVMALQDCVNLAIFLIRSTIDAQKLIAGLRGCGGPIDVAIITRREGLKYIQKKVITGEKI